MVTASVKLTAKQADALRYLVQQYAPRASFIDVVKLPHYAAHVAASFVATAAVLAEEPDNQQGWKLFHGAARESLFTVLDFAKHEAARDGNRSGYYLAVTLLRTYSAALLRHAAKRRKAKGLRITRHVSMKVGPVVPRHRTGSRAEMKET